jgi:hypothetical protein
MEERDRVTSQERKSVCERWKTVCNGICLPVSGLRATDPRHQLVSHLTLLVHRVLAQSKAAAAPARL